MRKNTLLLASVPLLLLSNGLAPNSITASAHPNFIVIMADDLGANELSCYGHPKHETPFIDGLAKQGIRFRTCYATPNCSSTRVMVMTGRYGFRTGWYDFLEREYSPAPGSPQFDIGRAELTFADVLKAHGYRTALAGKWQLPGSPTNRIIDCGFDEYCAWSWKHQLPEIDSVTGKSKTLFDPKASLHTHKKTNRYWHPGVMLNAKALPTGPEDYGPNIYTDYACQFIKKNTDHPFLLYYPMVMIHKHSKGLPQVPDVSNPKIRMGDGSFRSNLEYLDHLVGKIVAAVDEAGISENTYIFFTADNGTADKGKGQVSEHGVRVPFIVKGPGIQRGLLSDDLVSLADVLPTLAELSGAKLPGDRTIDGVSQASALLNKPGKKREWLFSYLANERMLRDKRWLLEGDGQFYDCGTSRNGTGYQNVTDSTAPEFLKVKARFAKLLKKLPAPARSPSK